MGIFERRQGEQGEHRRPVQGAIRTGFGTSSVLSSPEQIGVVLGTQRGLAQWLRAYCWRRFGEDTLLMECCCLGGDGGIMAAAAVLPAELSKLYTLVATGELAAAQQLNKKLRPIVKDLFCESNPIPVKYALHKLFGLSASLRSPMCELDPSKHVVVDALLALLKQPW